MPAYGRRTASKANLVKESFPLPGEWIYQEISFNYSFQGFPTATIKAEGITEDDFLVVKEAFDLATNIEFNGIPFEVSQIGWSRQLYVYKDTPINIYTITANFDPVIKRKLETAIKAKRLGITLSYGTDKKKSKNTKKPKVSIQKLCGLAGVSYSGPQALIPAPEDGEDELTPSSILPEVAKSKGCYVRYGKGVELIPWEAPPKSHAVEFTDIIQDGENTETFPPVYQGVELTWDREDEELGEEEEDGNKEEDPANEEKKLPPRYDFVRVQTKIQTLTEEDVNYDKPPPDTKVLRTLDSTSWNSGPTRQHSVTTLYDGVELKSRREIWGFVYRAFQIVAADGMLFSSTPGDYWQIVEWQETVKVYEELGLVNLRVTGVNAADKNKKQVRMVIHPDYANFAKISSFATEGYIFSFQPKVEYLTQIITTGGKEMPLEKEPGPEQSLDDILDPINNPRFNIQTPKEIPKADRTEYRLASSRLYYREEDQSQNLPFQVDFQPFKELDKYIKEALRWQMELGELKPDTLIGVITPDINFVEPLVVLTESRTTNSFAYAADPRSTDEEPFPPLVAGEEGYFKLERTILEANKYRESITEYTATDPGFEASLTICRTAEKSGQAPQAESKPIKYDKKESPDYWGQRKVYQFTFKNPNNLGDRAKALPRYFVDSDLIGEGVPSGGGLSFPYAKSLGEAMKAAKVQLEIEHCQNSGQHQKTLSWYFPGIRDSDRVTVAGESFRVLSVSVTVNQYGRNAKFFNGNLQLTDGTQITLGPEKPRKVSHYQVKDDSEDSVEETMNPDQGATPAGDGQVQAKFIGGTTELGGVLQPDSSRRRF